MFHFFDQLNIFKFKGTKQVEKNLSEIENTLKDIHLKRFVYAFYETHKLVSENQYLTYIGLNFEDGEVESIKFYAHIFNEISEKELRKFLPSTEDYFSFLGQKNSDSTIDRKNVGTVLEIKFKKGNDLPTYGFFYMLKHENSVFDYLEAPKLLPEEIASNCEYAGINFEYNGTQKTKKLYYYFNSLKMKDYFESRNKKSIQGNIIEYSEGAIHSKLNCYFEPRRIDFSFQKGLNKVEIESVIRFSEKFGLKLFGHGSYHSKLTNSYYLREYNLENLISKEVVHQYSDVFKKLKITDKK
jgi:hypothetical protein